MGLAGTDILWSMEIEYSFFTNEETSAGKEYDETLICQMIDLLIDNIYIKISNHLFQVYTIPQRYLPRGACSFTDIRNEKRCHIWIYSLTYQMVTLFAQLLKRRMHLISILSIFPTYLGILQQPQLIVHTSHS